MGPLLGLPPLPHPAIAAGTLRGRGHDGLAVWVPERTRAKTALSQKLQQQTHTAHLEPNSYDKTNVMVMVLLSLLLVVVVVVV